MKTKYDIHDIVVYDHQGVLTATSILKIEMLYDRHILYTMANGVTVSEDQIKERYGNLTSLVEDKNED